MSYNSSHHEGSQSAARLFPILGAVMVVLIWYAGADGLAQTGSILRMIPPMEVALSRAEFFQALAVALLIIGVAGIGTILICLLRRQRRLEALLRSRDRELEEGRSHLRRCFADLERVADIAANDLPQPLQRMTSSARMLSEAGSGLDDKARFQLVQVIDGVHRVNSLLSGLGGFVSIGGLSGHVAITAPSAAVAVARRRLASVLSEADAALIVDPLPEIIAEPNSLAEIFTRLIGNSVRFRSPSRRPVIHISAVRDGAAIAFRVRDNGLGIEPARAARLFEIFRHSGGGGGSLGMGLVMVRRLVERMGGKIWVDLVPGQTGTTFGFTLPSAAHPTRRANDIRTN